MLLASKIIMIGRGDVKELEDEEYSCNCLQGEGQGKCTG